MASKSDKDWLLNVQRKLYARSWENPDYEFQKLWGLVTDRRNLRCALARVTRNKGARTAGVDGVTVRKILRDGAEDFIERVRAELRSRQFKPSPARRVYIPKPMKPEESRPLGIPTVKDRVVQAAMKHIMEPIFEADFYPSSFGFRPGKSVHGALEQLRKLLTSKVLRKSTKELPRLAYQWVIEGDIKGCFDNISHHGLMVRLRRRIGDRKLSRLVLAFLKSGVMSEEVFTRTEVGTPQGGILSPLLANIALGVIDERYERYVWPRRKPRQLQSERDIRRRAVSNRSNDRQNNKPVFVPVRYADDFIILVCAPRGPHQKQEAKRLAEQEKAELSRLLKEALNLELSETKTLITPVTSPARFLGYHLRVQRCPVRGWAAKLVIPKTRSKRLRECTKVVFKRNTIHQALKSRLEELNPIIKGWGNFYRHGWGAKKVFSYMDHHLWFQTLRWLRKKHPRTSKGKLCRRYGERKPGKKAIYWQDGATSLFQMATIRVQRYRAAWETRPAFVSMPVESPVHIERCTPGSEVGARKTGG